MHRQLWRTLKTICDLSLLAACLAVAPAYAQLELGDNLKMNLNGQVGVGYSGGYGDYSNLLSNHNLFLSGIGYLNGSYYNPNFLNFNVQPFYNRNQDNSTFQSVFSETGIDSSANLFSGSHFPGSVSYAKSFQTGSQYGLPGQNSLTGDGSTQIFSIRWSALIPDWPTLTASFSDSTNTQNLLGDVGTSHTAVRSFGLYSTYKVAGWQLLGSFNHQNFDTVFPTFLLGGTVEGTSTNTTYTASATHALPLSGTVGLNFTRSTYTSDTEGFTNNGSADTVGAAVSLNPIRRLNVTAVVRYYDNALGVLQNDLVPGAVPIYGYGSGSHGLTLNSFASVNLGHNLTLIGYANRQMQHFSGEDFTSDQYGATLSYAYSRPLLGMLYVSFGVVGMGGNNYQSGTAFVGSLGLKKQIRRWDVNADVSYAQNVQSSIALYTTSNYNYGGFVRRRFGSDTYWSVSARGVQSGLTQLAGYSNRSETFLTTLRRGRFGLAGSYSTSNGTSVLTTSGALTPTPLATVISPDQILYNGNAYGASFNVIPVKKLLINISWYKTGSNTLSPTLFSNNDSTRTYAELQYNLRKLQLRATYWRVNQLISSSGKPRTSEASYSFSVYRWFNIF
jgi:hypothetical protein